MTRFTIILILLALCNSCSAGYDRKKVHEAKGTLPALPQIDITKPDRFLNDLMLSPYWKVEKRRDGAFIAKARSIRQDWPSDSEGSFLFEFMANQAPTIPENYRLHNKYLDGDKLFFSFQVIVVFQKPDLSSVTLGASGETVSIPVYESFESKIGPNSGSDLAIKLSGQDEIYVILHEQGSDPDRKTTFSKILPAMKELASLANTPEAYRVKERYADFFKIFFTPALKDETIKRFPGIQDRDTFYGYFQVKPGTSYAGINIKISHPVYCPGEGTRRHSRLQKAEYLGKPYREGDIVFFLIEDNAVYLSGEYDQRFGTFTGKESFEGNLEVLNNQEKVLLKTKGKFKGWQR
ncbi:MAG: hypothetical protein D6B27_00805 [Gammaproteobacteria bacterium]|nr:MAG: hypothetical protein D6B27_00805 [Gammaproteobacteria bacterium]